MFRIGICSIGSGIGRAVLDSCKSSDLNLITFGLGNDKFAQSAFDCDHTELIPSFYCKSYIGKLTEVANKHKIDLLIPGHDDESKILAENRLQLEENGVVVVVPPLGFLDICRNKLRYKSSFTSCRSLFVESFTSDQALTLIGKGLLHFPLIAKPLSGFASTDVSILDDEESLAHLPSCQIVQQIAMPETNDLDYRAYKQALTSGRNLQVAEVSIQLLFNNQSDLVTWCATRNSLKNGVPISVIPLTSSIIDQVVRQLQTELSSLKATGPINIQGRITDHGFKIFEINARFTGITGIRAALGFNEVEGMIRHHLLGEKIPMMRLNKKRIGLRSIRSSVISTDDFRWRFNEEIHIQDNFSANKTVLITGSTGVLGNEIVRFLGVDSEFCIWTLSSSLKKPLTQVGSRGVQQAFDWSDLSSGKLDLRQVDVILHLGSARPWESHKAISLSMQLSTELFNKFAKVGMGTVIFASSQSVYDSSRENPWNEDHPIIPDTPYSIHKYALELVLQTISQNYAGVKVCILRLASLVGETSNDFGRDIIHRMIDDALSSGVINVLGGSQLISRLHYQDALTGIRKCLDANVSESFDIYNLANNERVEVKALALTIQKNLLAQGHDVKIKYSDLPPDKSIYIPNSDKFMGRFFWAPRYTIRDIIKQVTEARVLLR